MSPSNVSGAFWRFGYALAGLSFGATVVGTAVASANADQAVEAKFAALRAEARAYEHGEGVAKDVAHAAQLYCDGARMGDAEAQFSLGWMYANGRGVPHDDALASYFFSLAARQGLEQAGRMVRFVGEEAAAAPPCMLDLPLAKVEPDPSPEEPFVPTRPDETKVADIVQHLAPEFRLRPQLVLAVIRVESNFDARARSSKNAQGLMQLVPETAARFNVRKPFDPIQNIRGGMEYLRWLLAYYRGDVALVAAAYNAGEKTVDRYRGIPPYVETRDYVRRILSLYRDTEHPYDAAIAEPSPELSRVRTAKQR